MIDFEVVAKKMYVRAHDVEYERTGVRKTYTTWEGLSPDRKQVYLAMAIVAMQNTPAPIFVDARITFPLRGGEAVHMHLYLDTTQDSVEEGCNKLKKYLLEEADRIKALESIR